MGLTEGDIVKLFTYRKWSDAEVRKYSPLRQKQLELALELRRMLPECAETTLALRALHQCSILVNTAVTMNPLQEE